MAAVHTLYTVHVIRELLHFALLLHASEKFLHFALNTLLHFASMLLHFTLVLHLAAILITFCGDYYILRRNTVFVCSVWNWSELAHEA